MLTRTKLRYLMCLLMSLLFNPSFATENKILRVCTTADFFPFESKTSDGKWVGSDIDMMQAFSSYIHANLQIIDIRWDGVIVALLSKKCDFIVGGMSITQERMKIIAFSKPILKNKIVLLANKTDLPNEESIQDIDKENRSLAIRSGTTADAYLTKHPPTHLKVLKFDDNATLINALLTGKVNAIAQDKTLLSPILKAHANKLRMLGTSILEEDIAVAARKQDVELLAQFNEFLKNWKR